MKRERSVRQKTTAALWAAIVVALVLATLGTLVFEYGTFRPRVRASLDAIVQATNKTFVSAIETGNTGLVETTLQDLRGKFIVGSWVVLADGREIAAPDPSERDVPAGGRPGDSNLQLKDSRALFSFPLQTEERIVGHLYLVSDITPFKRSVRQALTVMVVSLGIMLVAGALIARLLQRAVTRPIVELAETAARIHLTGDYGVRTPVLSGDEVGRLAETFNEMVAGIAARDRHIAESAAFQQAIVVGSGVAVISTTPSGIVRTFNPAAEQLLGFHAAEVVDTETPEIWHDRGELMRRAEMLTARLGQPVIAGFEAIVATVRDGPSETAEWTYIRKDGSRVPVSVAVSALRDAGGGLIGFCGLATDLTERKEAETALRASEERFKLLTQHAPDAIVVLDVESGRFTEANSTAERLFELPRQALLERGPLDLSPTAQPDGRPSSEAAHAYISAAVDGRMPVFEWLHCTGSGRDVTCEIRLMRLPDPLNRRVLLRGSIVDLTDRKLAEERIRRLNIELEQRVADRTAELNSRVAEVERLAADQRQLVEELRRSERAAERAAARLQEANASLIVANQELEAFSYSVSHDLRAPLRNISGFIELLRKRCAGQLDEESQRFFGIVTTETVRMGALIDDLLTFSRVGRTEMRLEVVRLEEIVDEVARELHHDVADRTIEWRRQPMPPVSADRALIRQVVANLLSNALKFTRLRNPAVVEIGARPRHPGELFVTCYIQDNGAGFNPQYVDKLFRVFQRLHNARDFEGTGIGLANVKRIVTMHGGRVWAEGRIDAGATFYFTLKAADPGA